MRSSATWGSDLFTSATSGRSRLLLEWQNANARHSALSEYCLSTSWTAVLRRRSTGYGCAPPITYGRSTTSTTTRSARSNCSRHRSQRSGRFSRERRPWRWVRAGRLGPGFVRGGCGQGRPPRPLRRSRPSGTRGEVAAGPGHDRRGTVMGRQRPSGRRGCRIRRRRRLPQRPGGTQAALRGRHLRPPQRSSWRRPARPTRLPGHRPTAENAVPRPAADHERTRHRGRPDNRSAGVLAGGIPARHEPKRLQARVLAFRRPADPARRRGIRKAADNPQLRSATGLAPPPLMPCTGTALSVPSDVLRTCETPGRSPCGGGRPGVRADRSCTEPISSPNRSVHRTGQCMETVSSRRRCAPRAR
ncbi:hypothetical protein SAURM35S_06872 [Streptomyces aurantiogriseus]